jgi:uncharacterized repeat protein (TIGR03803 family)
MGSVTALAVVARKGDSTMAHEIMADQATAHFQARRAFPYVFILFVFAVFIFVLLVALALVAQPANAQTETVLYNFCSASNCTDGADPGGGLIADLAGNLYGTTGTGGAAGGGVVFELTPAGDESVLYSFHNGFPDDGYSPGGPLTMDEQGNLYGTTEQGGAHSLHVARGDGIAYKVSPDGTETILYNFGAYSTDGIQPYSGMVLDANGNLYGTTYIGGVYTAGTIFRLTPGGMETVLHNFANDDTDGGWPRGTLIMDESGNLYGTTTSGGSVRGGGTVFELTAEGTYQTLHRFGGAGDGDSPLAGVTFDSQGNLYGTTYGGGSGGALGEGTVFELTPGSNGSWQETILYSFTAQAGSCQNPFSNVVFDSNGNLYGTTFNGGTKGPGWGCAYELSPSGKLTILHAFGEGADGASPLGNVVFSQGNLYGTTSAGGGNLEGTAFKITP